MEFDHRKIFKSNEEVSWIRDTSIEGRMNVLEKINYFISIKR